MKRLSIASRCVLSACCLFGWNSTGHMTVAISLTRGSRRRNAPPSYPGQAPIRRWVKGIPTTNAELIQLAVRRAALADDIRSTSGSSISQPARRRRYRRVSPASTWCRMEPIRSTRTGTSSMSRWTGRLDKLAPFDDHGKFRTRGSPAKIADAEAALAPTHPYRHTSCLASPSHRRCASALQRGAS